MSHLSLNVWFLVFGCGSGPAETNGDDRTGDVQSSQMWTDWRWSSFRGLSSGRSRRGLDVGGFLWFKSYGSADCGLDQTAPGTKIRRLKTSSHSYTEESQNSTGRSFQTPTWPGPGPGPGPPPVLAPLISPSSIYSLTPNLWVSFPVVVHKRRQVGGKVSQEKTGTFWVFSFLVGVKSPIAPTSLTTTHWHNRKKTTTKKQTKTEPSQEISSSSPMKKIQNV